MSPACWRNGVLLGLVLWALIGALWLGLSGCTSAFVLRPPRQYRGTGLYAVRTVPTAKIATACAGATRAGEEAFKGPLLGCFKNGWVIVPDPAEWRDPYGQILLHEFSHANGWPGDHPGG